MKPIHRFLTAILAGAVLSQTIGCSTLFRGTSQSIKVNSIPEGLLAQTSDGNSCLTPCKLKLKRNQMETIYFKNKDGCRSSVSVEPGVSGIGIVLGMPAGVFIVFDALSGAIFSLHPNPVLAEVACHDES